MDNNFFVLPLPLNAAPTSYYISFQSNNFTCPLPTWCDANHTKSCTPCVHPIVTEYAFYELLNTLVNNDLDQALNISNLACTYSKQMPQQEIACKVHSNLMNGLSFFQKKQNNINAFNWKKYSGLVTKFTNLMGQYEDLLESLNINKGNLQEELSIANQILSYTTGQIDIWNNLVSDSQTEIQLIAAQFAALRIQITYEMTVLENDFNSIVYQINSDIATINAEIGSINSDSFFDTLGNMVQFFLFSKCHFPKITFWTA